ncbi:MAG: hypothetical protein HY698_16960 [Deltaproteobacteria bacterium]|nr:hypothetical protein [Deltaproteobacteria bacterium]
MNGRLLIATSIVATSLAGARDARAEQATKNASEAAPASAEDKATAPLPEWLARVELGGVAFLFYRLELTYGADEANTFDLSRMYFFALVAPMDHVRFRMTLDAPNREATVTVKDGTTAVGQNGGKFDVVVKHAYAELVDVVVPGLSIKFGMQDLPWVPFEEKIWTYRFQGPIFVDREGYLSSTDLGLGASYAHPGKWAELSASLVNGETWSKPEVSKHKDIHARLTVRPLASRPVMGGLSFSAFGSLGWYQGGDDQDRHRLILQSAFEHKYAAIAAEYFRAWDPPAKMASKQPSLAGSTGALATAQGLSAFGWLDLGVLGAPEGIRLVGRVEWLDPDTDLADKSHVRAIFGIGYRASKYVQALVDAELVQYDDQAGVAEDEKRLFLHSALGF